MSKSLAVLSYSYERMQGRVAALVGVSYLMHRQTCKIKGPFQYPESCQHLQTIIHVNVSSDPDNGWLQAFLASSGDAGVVYVSLGTVCSIGAAEFRELASALSALPAHVVWKVGKDDLPAGLDLGSLALGSKVKVTHPSPSASGATGLRA